MLAVAARAYGLLFMFESGERYSLVLTIAALVLMVGGWQVFRRVFWILLILFLMVPFPGRIHNMISGPLQSMATTGAVFVLEAFIKVSRQGNIVTLNDRIPMAVVEACSGLRMLTAFIIVAAFMAYMVKRSRWQKAFLLLSSVPVAVMCNILRLCMTAVLFLVANSELAEKFFHDFAGIVMMPAAVLLMFAELWLMDKLTVSEPDATQVVTKARTELAGPALCGTE
jgi:exosortase